MRKKWPWIVLGVIVLLIAGISFYLDTILRDSIERNMNRALKGYTVHIGAVSFHPIGFSLDLLDTTMIQNAHPDPPVLHFPLLHASVHWGALLHRSLVADFLIARPKAYVNLTQATTEIKSKTPIKERGWQDALEAIYPLKINVFQVQDAELTYVDRGPFRPLQLSHVNFYAENIRNVRSPEKVYPSDISLKAVVFGSGKIDVEGNADFMAEPMAAVRATVSLENIGLDYFKPITSRYNLTVQRGTFSASGQVEYAAKTKEVDLQEISIRNADMEYVHKGQTAEAETQTAQQVQQTAKQVSNNPGILLRVDKVNILQSNFRFRNETTNPPYRLFFTDANIRFANVSNQRTEGRATGSIQGKFMGSGDSTIDLAFWPVGKSLDFDLKLQIDGTEMASLNDLLRGHTGFDVAGGQFSLYSEVSVRENRITGYIKPLFKGLTVADQTPGQPGGFLQKIKQGLIQVLAKILENRPRHEVATQINLSGSLDDPKYSSWKAFVGLLKNAFIQPLLPGLEKQSG